MPNNYNKSFDDILQSILTDYGNLDPAPDISQGSPVYIKACVLASAIWSLYKYNDWIDKQRMPGDEADTDSLDRWGTIFNIIRQTGETDSDYVQRIISTFSNPPAGGTAADYETWALAATDGGVPANVAEDFLTTAVDVDADNISLDGTVNALGWVDDDPIEFTTTGALPDPLVVGTTYYAIRQDTTSIQVATSAGGSAIDLTDQGTGVHQVLHSVQTDDPNSFYVDDSEIVTPNSVPVATEPGTVTVVLVPNDENILDSSNAYYPASHALEYLTNEYIQDRRPVTAGINTVAMEDTTSYDISIACSPITTPVLTVQNDILSYVNSLTPGAVMYKVQLEAIALRDGAVNASVTEPTFDANGRITPDTTVAIRANSVTVDLTSS